MLMTGIVIDKEEILEPSAFNWKVILSDEFRNMLN
jgi:hypothetical protein